MTRSIRPEADTSRPTPLTVHSHLRRDFAGQRPPPPLAPAAPPPRPPPLSVHSHLRWDFVWQRPQQLLSRFAQHAPVLFVEEPIFVDDLAARAPALSTPPKGGARPAPS